MSSEDTVKAELGTKESLGKRATTKKDVIELIKREHIQVVDCCFTDPLGLWHHCTFAANQIDDEAFDEGLPFDGSSIKMFKVINESDMLMKPDPTTAWVDPFLKEKTLHLTCSILEPDSTTGYSRDPRSIAQKAVEYLQESGIADMAFFGPEAEFFIFDDVRYEVLNNSASYTVDAHEGYWNMNKKFSERNNLAHRVEAKQGYFPVSPIDNHTDIRTEMLLTMGKLGVPIEKHHHEVATAQSELGFRALPLIECADALQIYKYVIKNVAKKHDKTVTFMPKPIYGDNGTGMHIHSSLWKNGQPLFYDKNGYAGLSEMALNYIGGILHHAKSILAFTNSTTNSYKRLVPGFEAPVNLVYSQGNRSAAIRIPMYHPHNPKAKRAEFRCPDALANPYIAFAVIMLAGLDGIKKKLPPGEPLDVDIYELSDGEREHIKTTPPTLGDALDALEKDHDFLLEGGVFTQDYLDAYIALKRSEIKRIETAPHPLEFVMYYHL